RAGLLRLLELVPGGGRAVVLLFGLLGQEFGQLDEAAQRHQRQPEQQREELHCAPSGACVMTKSYGAMGPSRCSSMRSCQSCAILPMAFSSSSCSAVSASTATLAASSSCVGSRTLLATTWPARTSPSLRVS